MVLVPRPKDRNWKQEFNFKPFALKEREKVSVCVCKRERDFLFEKASVYVNVLGILSVCVSGSIWVCVREREWEREREREKGRESFKPKFHFQIPGFAKTLNVKCLVEKKAERNLKPKNPGILEKNLSRVFFCCHREAFLVWGESSVPKFSR